MVLPHFIFAIYLHGAPLWASATRLSSTRMDPNNLRDLSRFNFIVTLSESHVSRDMPRILAAATLPSQDLSIPPKTSHALHPTMPLLISLTTVSSRDR